MIVVGLTGSIGMGKSTTARMFENEGAAVFDADQAVAELYGPGGKAVGPIAEAFPDCASEAQGVDRALLSAALQSNPEGFEVLEHIVHPLVAEARADFFMRAEGEGKSIVVLDVPLLFETGQADQVDAVVVASAPAELQRERVLARPSMTEAKFKAILARQTPDSKKREAADFIVETGRGMTDAQAQVSQIVKSLMERAS